MAVRDVIAYVYPGTRKSGVAVVELIDQVVNVIAIGSVANEVLLPLLEDVRPYEMVVSDTKIHDKDNASVPVPESVRRFLFARPGWEDLKVPLVIDGKRAHGAYVHNVWKMAISDITRRRKGVFRKLTIEKFDREWAANSAAVRYR